MNVYTPLCSGNVSTEFSQHMVEALRRLQGQPSSHGSGRVYIYDMVEQCTLCATDSTLAMLGYAEGDLHAMGSLALATLIHPDDLEQVADHYQKFTTLKPEDVIVVEYRMKRADGTWSCLRSQETPLVMTANGFPLQVLGLLQDVTQNAPASVRRSTFLDQSLYSMN